MEHTHEHTEYAGHKASALSEQSNRSAFVIGLSIIIAGFFVIGAWVYARNPQLIGGAYGQKNDDGVQNTEGSGEEAVIPKEGIVLPIVWGDLGKRMIAAGVIDEVQFKQLYANRGGLTAEEQAMLLGNSNEPIRITRDNANFILNMLWAYGLAQKSPILEQGEMTDARYGGNAGQFASTGGWTLAKGDPMRHYSAHAFVSLTAEQQALVERVSRGIYRPCCGNSTHFPDCNHGMAMLGLLELMAANGVSEDEMYVVALQVNAYWFPDTYLTLAKYFKMQGTEWNAVDPKTVLGAEYSSAAGYKRILSIVEPVTRSAGGGCGV